MAVLDFSPFLWIARASDLSDALGLEMVTWDPTLQVPVNLSERANGRYTASTGIGRSRTLNFQAAITSRDEVSWLEDHVAMPVLVRSPRGPRLWCIYAQVQAPEPLGFGGDLYKLVVSLDFAELTVTEVV